MKIGEAAKAVGLPVKTVRYYSDIGLVIPTTRSKSGYRRYDSGALHKLTFIRRARMLGFSIKDCRELLGLYEDKARKSFKVQDIAKVHLKKIEKKQEELQRLYNELADLINHCPGDNTPDCPIIEGLSAPQ